MSNNVNLGRSDDVLKQFRDRVNSERNMFYDQFNPSWTRRPFVQDFYPGGFESRQHPEDFARSEYKPRERYSSESDYVNPCYSDGTFKDRDSIPIKVIHESSKAEKKNNVPYDRVRSLVNEDSRKQRSTSAPPQREPKGVIRDNSCPDASLNSENSCGNDQKVTVIPVKVVKLADDKRDSAKAFDEEPPKDNDNVHAEPGKSTASEVKDPLEELIGSVKNEVSALEKQVDNGPKSQKEILYLDEMLTRQMLRLDNIEVGDRNDIRLARKAVVRHIQSCLDKLDSLRMDTSSSGKSPDPASVAADKSTATTENTECSSTSNIPQHEQGSVVENSSAQSVSDIEINNQAQNAGQHEVDSGEVTMKDLDITDDSSEPVTQQ